MLRASLLRYMTAAVVLSAAVGLGCKGRGMRSGLAAAQHDLTPPGPALGYDMPTVVNSPSRSHAAYGAEEPTYVRRPISMEYIRSTDR